MSFYSEQLLLAAKTLTDILAFCEFSFGADIIIITDRPGQAEDLGRSNAGAPGGREAAAGCAEDPEALARRQ